MIYLKAKTNSVCTKLGHSDYLGSTSYITDTKANITQFDAYLPYGELLVDEHSSSEDMPYKFNGKELDQETGSYYYGARYMNPVTSLWYGVDALTEKYPRYAAFVYTYCNPIIYRDSIGKEGNVETIINRGNATPAMGRYGPQTRYELGGNTVVVNQKGEIITVFSNAPKTSTTPRGYYIPIKK